MKQWPPTTSVYYYSKWDFSKKYSYMDNTILQMPYRLESNWEMQSPSGNSGTFYTVSSRTVRKSNDGEWEVSWRALFSTGELFAVGWHDALRLLHWWWFAVPEPHSYWIQPQVPPLLVCSVISPHSPSAMSLEKEKCVEQRMTGMDETQLPILSKPFHFSQREDATKNQSVSSKGFDLHTTPFSNGEKH